MRAVIDTNIWISAVLSESGFCAPVVEALRQGTFSPVVSPRLLGELSEVGTRRRLIERYGLRPSSVARVVALLRYSLDRIDDPDPVPRVSRDPRDDIFVAVAAAARADCLVSRDDDL